MMENVDLEALVSFKKDTSSLRHEMKKSNMTPYIMNAIITRNETIDRPEKDWSADKGRAVAKDDDDNENNSLFERLWKSWKYYI